MWIILCFLFLHQQPSVTVPETAEIPAVNITILATKKGGDTYETVTDKEGKFTFHLPVGTYRLVPESPKKFTIFLHVPCTLEGTSGICELPTTVSPKDIEEVVIRKADTEVTGRLCEFLPNRGHKPRLLSSH